MNDNKYKMFPVIDIFAGPGGLGEGFASYIDERRKSRFRNTISIERERLPHQTLLLRHFFRSFEKEAPNEYYQYLEGEITREQLYARFPEKHYEAQQTAHCIELGPKNHENVRKLISSKLRDDSPWVLVGGPPCQAYSLVGRSRMMNDPKFKLDERHFLYREYLRIIADHRPPVFVMENVKGLLSAKVGAEQVIRMIVSDLSRPEAALNDGKGDLQYKLYSLVSDEPIDQDADPREFLVKAEEFGVPQARHRMFILGVRSDCKIRPTQLQRHEAPNVKQTIGQLPKIRSTLSKEKDDAERWLNVIAGMEVSESPPHGSKEAWNVWKQIRRSLNTPMDWPEQPKSYLYRKSPKSNHPALKYMQDDRLTVLTGHEARGHMASDLHRYFFAANFADVIGKSPKLSDFPECLLPHHRNVTEGREGKMFSDRFRVQLGGLVSTTITSHISKDGHYFIHYDPLQCRSLTVREAARLQTFPDNYSFEGPRTAQYHQVGNAVPPYLASQIAAIVCELLEQVAGP
tara:strand:- start:285 stop:1832 length:1548 start_codon:yes stop_codon:yes gene_type:complete